jgi:hypothetical protein
VCAIAALCVLSAAGEAQTRKSRGVQPDARKSAAVDAGRLGFVSVAAAELRPLWGTRDSLGLGPSVSASGADRVVVSASQTVALVRSESGWAALSLHSGTQQQLRSADLAALSHSGRAAVLYSRESRRLDVVAGLPGAAEPVFSADLSGISGPVVAAAVDEAGLTAVIAASDGRNGAVYVLRKGTSPVEIAQTGLVSALRFLQNGTVLIADRLWNQLLIAEAGAESSRVRMLADGLGGPAALAVDEARGRVFVANADARNVASFSLSGGLLLTVDCSFEPSQVAVVPGSELVAVSSAQGGSAWVFRPDAERRQLAFVPSVD